MRKLLMRCALTLGVITSALCAADVISAVRQADDARVAATLARDLKTLGELYSDDLYYAHSGGKLDTKASQIQGIANGTYHYTKFEYQERTFSVASARVVLMTGRANVGLTRSSGEKILLDLNYLGVWRLEQGKWRFLAWQASRNVPATVVAAAPVRPLDSPNDWTFADPTAWAFTQEEGQSVLTLKQQQNHKPSVRSPFNLAWLKVGDWKSFTLTVEGQLTKFDAGNNDLCIAFARQDDTRFYYAHLGEKADAIHHQLHVVDHADRRAITATRTAGSPWQPGHWHRLKVVHDTTTGEISVYFDDMTQPVLTAQDKALGHGWIGIGSFDDLGKFRNLEIRGERN